MMRSRGTRAAVAAALTTAAAIAMMVALPLGAHIERDPVFVDPAPDTSIVPAAGGGWVEARRIGDPAKRLRSFRRFAARAWDGELDDRQQERLLDRFVRLSKAQQSKAVGWLAELRQREGGPTADALGLTDPKVQAEETLVVCQEDSMMRLEASLQQVRLSRSNKRDRARKDRLRARNSRFMELCRFSEIQEAVNAADNNDTILVMPGFYTEPTSRAKPHNDPACQQYVAQGTRSAPAPTYEYHFKCPNDMNLIAVLGRALPAEGEPFGECIRCNLQIVGTGAKPEDVIVDGAKEPTDPGVVTELFEEGREQVEAAKEVGIRLEQTDGAFVGNLTANNFSEHGFYSIEADGVTFDKVEAYYNHEYGHLSFVTDHLIVQDGDFAGSSDAGIYPGASPPSSPRLNSIIRRNISHHNAIGLSGSMGSGLHIIDNVFTQNSTGITLDSISRAGHPGYPQRGTVIERNRIFNNNFDTYSEDAWVQSSTPAPIGVGILFAGGNDNSTGRNWIYDNWRWGIGLLSVPDIVTEQDSADDLRLSNSHRNRQIGNHMGVAPDGSKLPNGLDFWWDELGESNCWESNGEVTSDPPNLPDCETFPNIGHGHPVKEAMLAECSAVSAPRDPKLLCEWYVVPEKP